MSLVFQSEVSIQPVEIPTKPPTTRRSIGTDEPGGEQRATAD